MAFKFSEHNLRLLILQFVSEAGLARELWGITENGRSKVHTMIKRGVRAAEARDIEKKLGLPHEWFDRDNLKFSVLDADDYELVKKVLSATAERKKSIYAQLDTAN